MSLGLLDMPEVVMTKIIENAGIKGILTLRKVCHDLRNFIDDVKPDGNLEHTEIYGEINNSIIVFYRCSEGFQKVKYKKHVEGCVVENNNGGSGVLLKNEDFVTAAMKDFEIVLEHQKSVLKRFALSGRYRGNMVMTLLENIQRILKSRTHSLKVETFIARNMDQNEIMSILPFLNSKTLCELNIYSKDSLLEVDQLVNLDHWRNIKHLLLDCYVDLEYIQHFTHFTTNYIQFKTTHFPDLVFLKNIFLQSSIFQIIQVLPTDYEFEDVQRSTHLLGGSFLHLDGGLSWYCRIPDTNEVLEINVLYDEFWGNDIRIKLSKIEEYDVPRIAVIQN